MDSDIFIVTLLPSETDPPLRSKAYQEELERLEGSLLAEGLDASFAVDLEEADTSSLTRLGEFFVEHGKDVLVPLGTLVASWLVARLRRKVRIRVGEFEAEASSVAELKQVLKLADDYREKQPRVIS